MPQSSISERDFDVPCSLNHLAVRWNQPQAVYRIGNRYMPDLVALIAHHRAKMALVRELHCLYPKPRPQNAIQCGGCTATLEMTEHATTSFLTGSSGNFAGNHVADST